MIAVFAIVACNREVDVSIPEPVPVNHRVTKVVSVPVVMATEADEDGTKTKSVVTTAVENFKNAYLFAFASDGQVFTFDDDSPIAIYTEDKSFDWNLPTKTTMSIWAIVNPMESQKETLNGYLTDSELTKTDLASLVFTCSDPGEMGNMEDAGMPMSGMMNDVYLDSAEEPITFTLRRLFARYDIKINTSKFTEKGWNLTVEKIITAGNSEVPYFYTGDGAGFKQTDADKIVVSDMATIDDLEYINDIGEDNKSSVAATLYFIENCQGNPSHSASKWSTVGTELASEVEKCSYIEFMASATKAGYGKRYFKYRLYPGANADMKSNFDVIRNKHKKINITLDEPTNGFQWTASTQLKTHPGDAIRIPFETSIDKVSKIIVTCYNSNGEDITSSISPVIPSLSNNSSNSSRQTNYAYYGTATLTPSGDSNTGTEDIIINVEGGDGGDIKDNVPLTLLPAAEENHISVSALSIGPSGIWFLGTIEKDLTSDVIIQGNLGRTTVYVKLPKGTTAGGHYPLNCESGSASETTKQQYTRICSMFKSDKGNPRFTTQIYSLYNATTYDDKYKYIQSLATSSVTLEVAAPQFHILNAARGTNNYASMTPGDAADGETFYLMYGFKKTYFIDKGDLAGTPSVSLSVAQTSAPYLRYSLTSTSDSNIYRLDLWVDRYENPFDYNANAWPYSTDTDGFDSGSGDKSVTITVSISGTSTTKNLYCKVLHKRFYIKPLSCTDNSSIQLQMWNPMEFKISGTITMSSLQTKYEGADIVWASLFGGYVATTSELYEDSSEAAVLAIFGGLNTIGRSFSLTKTQVTDNGSPISFSNIIPNSTVGAAASISYSPNIGYGYQIIDLTSMVSNYGLPLLDNEGNPFGTDWSWYPQVWVEIPNKLNKIRMEISYSSSFSSDSPGLSWSGLDIRNFLSSPASNNAIFLHTDNKRYKVCLEMAKSNQLLIGSNLILNQDMKPYVAHKYNKGNPVAWFGEPQVIIDHGWQIPAGSGYRITTGESSLAELLLNGWTFGTPETRSYPIEVIGNYNNAQVTY